MKEATFDLPEPIERRAAAPADSEFAKPVTLGLDPRVCSMNISQELREYAAARATQASAALAELAGVGGDGPAGIGEAEMRELSERFREGWGKFMYGRRNRDRSTDPQF